MITSINEFKKFLSKFKKIDNDEKFKLIKENIYNKIDKENIIKDEDLKIIYLDKLTNTTTELLHRNKQHNEVGVIVKKYKTDYMTAEILHSYYWNIDTVLDIVKNNNFNSSSIFYIYKSKVMKPKLNNKES